MEADISWWASGLRQKPLQRDRTPSADLSRAIRIACALGTMALCGCDASDAKRAVEVRLPTPAPSDAGEHEAGMPQDAAPPASPHGAVPIWPASEQTLDLDYRSTKRAVLTLVPDPSQLDVHFNVDTTASFSEEIDAIQQELTRSIIPRLRSRVSNTQLGVSRFADFPIAPFGRPATRGVADVPYKLLSAITDVLSKVTTGVYALDRPLGEGGDVPESSAEALYQIATGEGLERAGRTIIAPFDRAAAAAQGGGTVGGVGFRPGAFRVVVHITDAPAHTPAEYATQGLDTHSLASAALALRAVGARVIGIYSTGLGNSASDRVRAELSELALATGAHANAVKDKCPTGLAGALMPSYGGRCPWVFEVDHDGTGLAKSITDAVVGLLDDARFTAVHAEVGDDPLGFIEKIELMPMRQQASVPTPQTSDLLPAGAPDGIADSYLDVNREHKLGFAVTLRDQRIAPSSYDQRFRVSVRLVADSVLLEERVLAIRIPAGSQPVAADEDAGPGP
jgi:hypothetical protein